MQIEEAHGNLPGVAQTCNQLAIVAKGDGRPADAERWYLRAIEVDEQLGNPKELAPDYNNLAALYLSQNRLAEAETYARRALAIMETLDLSARPWVTYGILAQIAAAQDRPQEAAQWRRKEQESYAAYAGSSHQMQQYQPLIQAIVAACQGSPQAQQQIEPVLQSMENQDELNRNFALAARRVLAGETNEITLTENLGRETAYVIRAILAQLAGESPAAAQPRPDRFEKPVRSQPPLPPQREGISLEQLLALVGQAIQPGAPAGPNALDGAKTAGRLTPDTVDDFLAGSYPEPRAKVYGRPLLALKRIGEVNPLSLSDYEAHGGYQGLRKALAMTPDAIIEANKSGEILGRGGAMFPLGLKAEFVRSAPGRPSEKHVAVNADESEPGAFKDRTIMEEDPFSLIEAATLMAYAVGAENGWILVRGEYPRSYRRLSKAVAKARAAGYLGDNILGRDGFHFDIEMRLGAGAYICGEETALFEAIEGKRGFPRIKPPYPLSSGLFNQPTSVNNVETLVMALTAFNLGLDAWRQLGTEKSPGTKLFCLSGHIARPGTYELPFGVTIRELIEMAGGVPGGRALQAVLVGGAAGVFIGPDKLDMPLTYEDARANKVALGSGALMVFDETADLRHALANLGRFFAHESCGKCYPCQLGTQRQMEILDRIAHGNGRNGGAQPTDKQKLLDIGFAMTHTSLCGLGQTASTAVLSAIELWPELAL